MIISLTIDYDLEISFRPVSHAQTQKMKTIQFYGWYADILTALYHLWEID